MSHDEFKALHRLDIGLTKDQVRALLNVVDDDHSGEIDINEFLRAAESLAQHEYEKRKNATMGRILAKIWWWWNKDENQSRTIFTGKILESSG